MPSRFRSRRARRPRRRRRGGRHTGMSTRRAAFKALAHIDMSVKYIDSVAQITPFDGTPFSGQLNLLAEGTEHFNRIGQGAKFKAISVKMLFTNLLPGFYTWRVMLVWDRQPNGAAFNPADLLEITATSVTTHLNLANSHRFRVLAQKMVWTDTNQRSQRFVTMYKTLNLTSRWDGPTTAIGALRSGMLTLVIFATQPTANEAQILVETRLRFVG